MMAGSPTYHYDRLLSRDYHIHNGYNRYERDCFRSYDNIFLNRPRANFFSYNTPLFHAVILLITNSPYCDM